MDDSTCRAFVVGYDEKQVKPMDFVLMDNSSPTDASYHAQVIRDLLDDSKLADLRFLMKWGLEDVPEFIDAKTVVFHIGDERYQSPSWYKRAFAVFKTGGRGPEKVKTILGRPMGFVWRELTRRGFCKAVHLRRRLSGKSDGRAALHGVGELPLGYFAQYEPVLLPVEQRPTDVAFAGKLSVSRGQLGIKPSGWVRARMAQALHQTQLNHPDLRVELISSASPTGQKLNARQYTDFLSRAKISLCPQGNFDETFRMIESARAGCVIISDALATRWYTQQAGVIVLRDWNELGATLRDLKANPARMGDLSRASRRWYEQSLAPSQVARHIAHELDERRLAIMR